MAVIMIRTARCTFLRNSDGNRYFLYLNRNDDGSWNWNYNWLDNDRKPLWGLTAGAPDLRGQQTNKA